MIASILRAAVWASFCLGLYLAIMEGEGHRHWLFYVVGFTLGCLCEMTKKNNFP